MKKGANLVEITSVLENRLVGRFLDVSAKRESMFWTGGVVNQVLDTQMKFWHGSQNRIEYDNDIHVKGSKEKPKGIVIQKQKEMDEIASWKTEEFDALHNFICEFPQTDIGCILDDDFQGEKYTGAASHDKEGSACIPWSQAAGGAAPAVTASWSHSLCRNPDGDEMPYCFINKDTPSYCKIPTCKAARAAFTSQPTLCPVSLSQPTSSCFKVKPGVVFLFLIVKLHRRSTPAWTEAVSPKSMCATVRLTVQGERMSESAGGSRPSSPRRTAGSRRGRQ